MNYAVNVETLYSDLEQAGVDVLPASLCSFPAIASPRGYIVMDSRRVTSSAQEREILIHEEGHFATNTFYQYDSPYTIRQHQENVATRWGYNKYFPLEAILDLMRAGYTESWQLAEQLGVSAEYVCDMLAYYQDACGVDFVAAAKQAT